MLSNLQEKQFNQALLQLGLSAKEVQVYFAALKKRYSTIISLANDIGLSRGSVYDIVLEAHRVLHSLF